MSPQEPSPSSAAASANADRTGSAPWFVRAFDEFYPLLYAHRDDAEATRLLQTWRERGKPEPPVLDLACGAGRLLRALDAEGFAGVGIDLSAPLLWHARRSGLSSGAVAKLVRGDMRHLPLAPNSVGSAVLLFTSFGYFESAEADRAVLEELARVVRAGGEFLVDHLNAAETRRALVPRSTRQVEGRAITETRWIDEATGQVCKSVAIDGRPAFEERVRLYEPEELEGQIRSVGFEPLERWGDYSGAPFAERSPRCIVRSRRSER